MMHVKLFLFWTLAICLTAFAFHYGSSDTGGSPDQGQIVTNLDNSKENTHINVAVATGDEVDIDQIELVPEV